MTRCLPIPLAVLCACVAGTASSVRASPELSVGPVVSRVLHLVDRSRSIHLPDGRRVARPVTTYLQYPAGAGGPWPLIVFGPGYRATPSTYTRLVRTWVLAGYAVASLLFPLTNLHAPGGPDEADIFNQPRDMSFVISQIVASTALRGVVDASHIAVAGHSDGAETAFAVAYAKRFRDGRIDAALILSGAQMPGLALSSQTAPPLLAVQGSRDRVNNPRYSRDLYSAVPRPKFLLTLLGGGHLPPYTTDERRFDVVVRVTTAFLGRYLKDGQTSDIFRAAAVPGVAALEAAP